VTLADVEKRLKSAHVVEGIVTTMRTLSAVQLRRGSEVLEELREFEAVLRESLGRLPAATLSPAPPTRVMMVVVGSDQGMCGALTRRIVARALSRREYLAERMGDVVGVGHRTVDELSRAGVSVAKVFSAPTSVAGAERLVERIGRAVEGAVVAGAHDGVEVVYTQHLGIAAGAPAVTRVFPIERERLLARGHGGSEPRDEPVRAVQLLEPSADVAQAVYDLWTITETYRAAIEALAAEHAARLRTTDAATHSVQRRIEDLLVERNHVRQAQITEELLEIVAGADASG